MKPRICSNSIAKAPRMTASLLATLTFFFTTIQAKVEALALAPEIEAAVHQQLIPAIDLERVANRSSRADERHALRQLSARPLEPLRGADSVFATLASTTREEIERVAGECADLFQCSSSCVEGRNGQLVLHHHGTHRLSEGKPCALTAMHNYFIRRPDGTTREARFRQ